MSHFELATFRAMTEKRLEPYLGRFNAGNRPAIWVDGGDLPSTFSGLGCLIHCQPFQVRTMSMSNGVHVSGCWRVDLQQRDRSPPGLEKLDLAAQSLRSLFPDPRNRERSEPLEDGLFVQVTFLIYFDYFTPKSCNP